MYLAEILNILHNENNMIIDMAWALLGVGCELGFDLSSGSAWVRFGVNPNLPPVQSSIGICNERENGLLNAHARIGTTGSRLGL